MENQLTDYETNIIISNLSQLAIKCDYISYAYIKNALDQLIIPFPAITINVGKFLFRSRRHLNNENFFHKISELSHRSDVFKISEFGRANEPCQSIFYCSDRHELAIAETTPILKEELNLNYDIITTGIWEVKKEIRIASLLNHPVADMLNSTQHFLDSKAKHLIESFPNDNTDQLLKMHSFISNEFQLPLDKNSHKYLISCAFANYVYSNLGFDTYSNKSMELDGIIYPSAVFPIFGMNLALKPSVILEGKTVLIGARKSKLFKTHGRYYEEIETIDTRTVDLDHGVIKWNIV